MDQYIINDTNVPAGPLLPPNDPPGEKTPFDPMSNFFSNARSPIDDPTVLGDISDVMTRSVAHAEIDGFQNTTVRLPLPVKIGEQTYTSARVRELTGADEEALAKAGAGGEPERMIDVLLMCGVEVLGPYDHPQKPNSQDILDLAVANRDALYLGIREATYGAEVKFDQLTCQSCDEDLEITYDLGDVPTRTGTDPYVSVALRRGGYAMVRFPSGADQAEIVSKIRTAKINRAEQDTILLARCVVSIVNGSGDVEAIADPMARARSMSMADRSAILRALSDSRPGPRLEEATVVCPACEKKTGVPLSLDVLFRG